MQQKKVIDLVAIKFWFKLRHAGSETVDELLQGCEKRPLRQTVVIASVVKKPSQPATVVSNDEPFSTHGSSVRKTMSSAWTNSRGRLRRGG
jgi:hypothetical protein